MSLISKRRHKGCRFLRDTSPRCLNNFWDKICIYLSCGFVQVFYFILEIPAEMLINGDSSLCKRVFMARPSLLYIDGAFGPDDGGGGNGKL
ncbi:hypothetical protein RJT34_10388 [Clitoria ternatea]|uniref:Uncharacterized protein n=1 Tax=Clitoria ternatea TaxID=43366 RepID=A0AAN9PV49_CLITE